MGISLGYRQAVRHSTLTAASLSSNLSSPVLHKIKLEYVLFDIIFTVSLNESQVYSEEVNMATRVQL